MDRCYIAVNSENQLPSTGYLHLFDGPNSHLVIQLTLLSGVIRTLVDGLQQIRHAFAPVSATRRRCHTFGSDIVLLTVGTRSNVLAQPPWYIPLSLNVIFWTRWIRHRFPAVEDEGWKWTSSCTNGSCHVILCMALLPTTFLQEEHFLDGRLKRMLLSIPLCRSPCLQLNCEFNWA